MFIQDVFVQCGTQPPIRPAVILECWYLCLYVVCSLLPSELKLSTYMTHRVRWRRQRMTPEARLQQAVQRLFSPDHSFRGKATFTLRRHLSRTVDKPLQRGTRNPASSQHQHARPVRKPHGEGVLQFQPSLQGTAPSWDPVPEPPASTAPRSWLTEATQVSECWLLF